MSTLYTLRRNMLRLTRLPQKRFERPQPVASADVIHRFHQSRQSHFVRLRV